MKTHSWILLCLLQQSATTYGFTTFSPRVPLSGVRNSQQLRTQKFDPFSLSENEFVNPLGDELKGSITGESKKQSSFLNPLSAAPLVVLGFPLASNAESALSTGDFNPEAFRPVCSNSDTFYRFLQSATRAVVGDKYFVEYGPLIAGGLLRIRLEFCVVESFFNEAVGPFIKENGINWVLPLHETVETFLAGSIFAGASTFILVGSTKIVTVVVTYADAFVGAPSRLFGGFFFDRARGKPVTLELGIGPWKKQVLGPPKDDEAKEGVFLFEKVSIAGVPVLVLSGSVKFVGEFLRVCREITEGVDLFVGRYLTLLATGYIGIKFLHFKIFPDFPSIPDFPTIIDNFSQPVL
mmetsp:Transcript_23467/g.36167  ORF Transcript_23467/g.36167 Transcript_23467/m.36167 type:complete len:351 (+) Transcript_23467:42-1094(+)